MKKTTKVALVIGALALVLTIGLVGGIEIRPFGDPPFGFINLK